MSGARNDTSRGTKSYRGGTTGGTMPPTGNTNPPQSWDWELLNACPGLEYGAAERSGDLPDSRPVPANAGNLA